MLNRQTVLLAVVFAGCTPLEIPASEQDAEVDAALPVDAAVGVDMTAAPDVLAPTDTPARADTQVPPDAPAPTDTPVGVDRPAPTDTPVAIDTPPPPVDVPAPIDVAMTVDRPTPVDTVVPVDTFVPVDVPAPRDVPVATDVPVGVCGSITSEVAAHVTAMATGGWSALNRSRAMMMYGCAGATRPQDCLATVPLADDSTIGANRSAVSGARLRVLYSNATRSNYWTRGSADGRFVGRGTHVHDLVRDVEIEATGAMYDPAFFPDNSGLMYQPGGRLCPMSVLTTGMPTSFPITGTGSRCAGSSVGLYEHLGASLTGGDFWSTSAGSAAWDDGGHSATLTETRRNETWGMSAQTSLSLMANTGTGFSYVGSRSVNTPFQGDAVISPSSQWIITRFVDEAGAYQGYILNALDARHTGAAIMASVHEIARYCIQGAKPAFSLNERYITYHHYVGGGPNADADARELGFTGASDSRFANYRSQGASNIYIMDLLTGRSTRVTTMGPGQYALYPHYRSDGWVYFLVRTLGTGREHVIASDAGFLLP